MGVMGPMAAEVFVISRSRFKKKEVHYTLTNAFRLVPGAGPKNRRGLNLPYRFYNEGYNSVDHYNRLLGDKSFKTLHSRSHWVLAVDDFYFSCLLLNAWILFQAVNSHLQSGAPSFHEFCMKLAHDLYAEVSQMADDPPNGVSE